MEPKVAPPSVETWTEAAPVPASVGGATAASTCAGSEGSGKKSDTLRPASAPPADCQAQDSSSENPSPVTGDRA